MIAPQHHIPHDPVLRCDLHSGVMLSRQAVHAAVVSSQITCFPRSNATTITLTVRCRIVPYSTASMDM